jgi:catechol 2,3-dioxygenase-like lactoylglutathione lyase family enzyme
MLLVHATSCPGPYSSNDAAPTSGGVASQREETELMTKVYFGNHAAVVAPRQERDKIRAFYCDVLGFKITREGDDKVDLQLGDEDSFHIGMLFGDFLEESEFLRSGRSIYLELKSDNVEGLREKIIDFGVTVIDMPDPHLYFQAPGGQVFRLVGITEDLTHYERDVVGDQRRNEELVTATRRRAEQS